MKNTAHENEKCESCERLRAAISAIQKATVDGRVCDDVAWFDTITTLYDFCDHALNPTPAHQQRTGGTNEG